MSVKRLFTLGNGDATYPQTITLTHPLGPFEKVRVSQLMFDNASVATDNSYYITLLDFNDHHDQTNDLYYFMWFYALANNVVSYAPSNDKDGWIYRHKMGLNNIHIGIMKDGAYQDALAPKVMIELEFCN